MPDEDNNFGGSLVLNFENDDVTCNPRIALVSPIQYGCHGAIL